MMYRKLTTLFTAAILIAAALTVHARPQDSLSGEWEARFETEGSGRTFYLETRTSEWKHDHTWGNSHKPGEFYGLDPKLATADGPARFELRREAGTLAFDGAFRSGKGSGTLRFTPSPEFVQNMKGLRYSNLPIDQLLAFATQDVTTQFVKDLNNLGYRNVPPTTYWPSAFTVPAPISFAPSASSYPASLRWTNWSPCESTA